MEWKNFAPKVIARGRRVGQFRSFISVRDPSSSGERESNRLLAQPSLSQPPQRGHSMHQCHSYQFFRTSDLRERFLRDRALLTRQLKADQYKTVLVYVPYWHYLALPTPLSLASTCLFFIGGFVPRYIMNSPRPILTRQRSPFLGIKLHWLSRLSIPFLLSSQSVFPRLKFHKGSLPFDQRKTGSWLIKIDSNKCVIKNVRPRHRKRLPI
ncbi:hypothetical protein LIER_12449 [Lithospermum erythrorhizon]|uniref:Uncharacterized protein n=1 Tax=Lithospermum erythrorhizon TaxID=34254 RepID=A0AAV3PX05_LITER